MAKLSLYSVTWGPHLSAGTMGSVMLLGPNPNPMLGFQASILRGLAPKPSTLGTPETHTRNPPSNQKETMLFGAAQNPQNGRNLHTP